jgi:hypothetical protein
MPVNSARIPLSREETARLPEGSAVYILWRDELPIHVGFVTDHTQTLSQRLLMHVPGEEPTPGGPTHFSYVLTDNPVKRLGEIHAMLERGEEPGAL